ncbi:MAG: DUF3488 and transglutaminase-like domain-containing protein [Betaproteobacteria bacterium]
MSQAGPALPAQRPIGPHEFTLLLAGLVIVAAPHSLNAPWWLILLTVLLYAWRGAAVWHPGLLPSRWILIVIVALGTAGIWLEFRAIFGRLPGVMLLFMFSGLKLLESRDQRDAAAVVFLTWFLAITNFLYTQSIPTALGMFAAVAASIAALVTGAAPRRAPRANLRTAGLLLGQAVPAALVLFLLFPRIQGPLWGLPQDSSAAVTGLSDTMAPGSLSQLSLSDAIAFRVEFKAQTPSRRALYWRGLVLADFDGRAWRLGYPNFGDLEPPTGGTRVEYAVLLEQHNRNWLFALERAASLPENARHLEDGQIVSLTQVRSRMRYELASVIDAVPKPTELRRVLDRARRLPVDFNPRARALAEGWRAAAADDSEVLRLAINYFRLERLQYTTEPPLLGRDSVDEFLFDTRQGFCEHFSSAFVFLLRAAGVPARVVTGYQGGETNPVDGTFTVRQSDAHAWTEVFIAGNGWIRVDPTALSVPGRVDSGLARAVAAGDALPLLMRPELEWLRTLRFNWEAMSHQWNLLVLGYNPDRQRELLSFFGVKNADWLDLAATLLATLGAFVLGLFAWMLRRMVRPDPVQKSWHEFCRKLGAKGVARAPQEGPRDYSERAARSLPALGEPIQRIAELYIALRYGAARAPEGEAELRRRVRELSPG